MLTDPYGQVKNRRGNRKLCNWRIFAIVFPVPQTLCSIQAVLHV